MKRLEERIRSAEGKENSDPTNNGDGNSFLKSVVVKEVERRMEEDKKVEKGIGTLLYTGWLRP